MCPRWRSAQPCAPSTSSAMDRRWSASRTPTGSTRCVPSAPQPCAMAATSVPAAAALRTRDAETARALADKAIATDRFDEPAYRLLMMACQQAGEPAAALAAYDRLRRALADELGVDPAPQTQVVHHAVLRQTPPPPAPEPR